MCNVAQCSHKKDLNQIIILICKYLGVKNMVFQRNKFQIPLGGREGDFRKKVVPRPLKPIIFWQFISSPYLPRLIIQLRCSMRTGIPRVNSLFRIPNLFFHLCLSLLLSLSLWGIAEALARCMGF